MKKIYHIAENVSLSSGGIRTILLLLHNYLLENKFDSTIITNFKEDSDDFIEFKTTKPWYYSKETKTYLNSLEKNSIFHLHGVYAYSQYIAPKKALQSNLPYIVSPHGMLEPWILNKGRLKKQLYLKLILNNILKQATILHAITPLEVDSIFKLTQHKNIIEIPNLIKFDTIPQNLTYSPAEDYFVFVGRIDSKKGIDLIIETISLLEKDVKLKILGIENEYSLYLKKLVHQLNLNSKIEFLGGIFGNKKFEIISNARALVAPSYSEAIGMVNLEAAACKTPVITTYQTGLQKEWKNNGGYLINPNVEELKKALTESQDWNANERIDRGSLLHNFAYNNYSWEKKGNLWKELYSNIIS